MRQLSLICLGLSSLVILITFVLPMATVGELLFALAVAVFPVALIALGASRGEKIGPVGKPLLMLLMLLLIVIVGLFIFRGKVETGPWFGGLPAAAAIQIYGLFLLPLLVTALGYARTFESFSLRSSDLDELRRRFKPSKDDAS